MVLSPASVEWAIQFVTDHSDGDLFPRVAEMAAIATHKAELAAAITKSPLNTISLGAARRFIVPKDELSYRQATQLHPKDSIILSAIVFQYGNLIEARRASRSAIFSYRYAPTSDYGLYDNKSAWKDFWNNAQEKAKNSRVIAYCDISDFYNQVAHHTVENQLIAAGLPNQVLKWIIALLESTTAGVSRGVPIGPHAAHIIAEASLIPVHNSMSSYGLDFVRYADDILTFSDSERSARQSLAKLASILDKQQRLILQRHKTKLFERDSFIEYCVKMAEDRPINDSEERLLEVIRKYSGGSPYIAISFDAIDPSDWDQLSKDLIEDVIKEYLDDDPVDFVRLRWFYRRLAQVGHPGGIEITLDNIEILTPCLGSICTYFSSVQGIDRGEWLNIGSKLLKVLQIDEFRESPYFLLSILSLFSKNTDINHVKKLVRLYGSSDATAKREIFLAAKMGGAIDWLREFKEDFDGMDQWLKMAYLYCLHDFPLDERKYFINRFGFDRPFEEILASWAKKGT